MKLDRILGMVLAGGAVTLACGCGSTTTCARAPMAPALATTELRSAVVSGPAPRFGKSQRDSDAAIDDAMSAPKEPRRTSVSRRAGGFGSWK